MPALGGIDAEQSVVFVLAIFEAAFMIGRDVLAIVFIAPWQLKQLQLSPWLTRVSIARVASTIAALIAEMIWSSRVWVMVISPER